MVYNSSYYGYAAFVKECFRTIPRFEHNFYFYRKLFIEDGVEKLFRIYEVIFHTNFVEVKISLTSRVNNLPYYDNRQYVFPINEFRELVN